jgi:16S rRNA (guanine966-N2)-methyltransferase
MMRITTGRYRGRNIEMPKGTRPTQDKVRKALFDILGGVEGQSFLELFAGSGAVGFEALSRGASAVTLVERDSACLRVINKNAASLGAAESCVVCPWEAEKAILTFHRDARKFDIIFLDPPYHKGKAACGLLPSLTKKTLQTLIQYDILAPNGFVVAEHFDKDELPAASGELALVKESAYGDTLLSFYTKKPL